MAWVRFPSLSRVFYKRKILEEIESLIGKCNALNMSRYQQFAFNVTDMAMSMISAFTKNRLQRAQ
ncbi:hypothetical protein Golob_021332, partial [Gossypium lobatum]|nr:hypothetical protein [Gossypium lobatum]